MNLSLLPLLVLVGFAVSYIVSDLSRIALGDRWPETAAPHAPSKMALAFLLALCAGPTLLAVSAWRMRARAGSVALHLCISGLVAAGWACLYGVVVMECASRSGLFAL